MEFAYTPPLPSTDTTLGATGPDSEGSGSGTASLRLAPVAKVSVVLPRRSVLVLNDDARYTWSHAIATRKTDLIDGAVKPRGVRTSLTFRTIRDRPCDCNFLTHCDRKAGDWAGPTGKKAE